MLVMAVSMRLTQVPITFVTFDCVY